MSQSTCVSFHSQSHPQSSPQILPDRPVLPLDVDVGKVGVLEHAAKLFRSGEVEMTLTPASIEYRDHLTKLSFGASRW